MLGLEWHLSAGVWPSVRAQTAHGEVGVDGFSEVMHPKGRLTLDTGRDELPNYCHMLKPWLVRAF